MKLLLAFLALAAIASAAVFRIPMTKIESNRARLTRLGKWRQYAIAKDLLRSKGAGHQDLTDYDDMEYIGNISVGTPATQQFRVLMSTYSGDSWVTDKGCTSCAQHSLFDSSKSTTFVPDGHEFHLTYGGMGSASGVFAMDTMTLGGKFGLTVPKQTFGQAMKLVDFPDTVDGVVGLGFSSIAIQGEPPVINAINQGLLDQPIFTVWLDRAGDAVEAHGGQITYGAFDAEHCNTNVVYQPLVAATSWLFRMKSVSAGSYSSSQGWMTETSMFDSFLSGPRAVIDGIANVLGATQQEGFYWLDCDHLPKDPIQFVIGSNQINIQPENYITTTVEQGERFCLLVLMGFDHGGYGPQWYLGIPFSRQECVVYDVEWQRIGFSPNIITH